MFRVKAKSKSAHAKTESTEYELTEVKVCCLKHKSLTCETVRYCKSLSFFLVNITNDITY